MELSVRNAAFEAGLNNRLELHDLKRQLNHAKTQLGYSEMSFRDLKIRENEPAWFADSPLSGFTLVRELKLAHGRVVNSKRRVKQIKKEIFEYKLKHGS